MLIKYGSSGSDVVKLQKGLAYFGFHPGAADGKFGKKTTAALEAWQEKAGLYADGKFGNISAKEWDAWCEAKGCPEYKLAQAVSGGDPEPSGPKLGWKSCPATPMPNGHGFKSLVLREDIAERYMALHKEVTDRGGYMTTAGGKRGLGASVGPSRSKTSFHYTGRAFDLATYSALHFPDTDPFLCVREEGSRYWTIWCRVDNECAPMADLVPEVTLDVTLCDEKKTASGKRYTQLRTVKWTGKAFNFTQLAHNHGFERIKGRSSFFAGGSYMGSEWWHFQCAVGMKVGESTFGGELLRVYEASEVHALPHWDQVKNAVYGKHWF